MNLRQAVERLRREGMLAEARGEAAPHLEIAGALAAMDGTPLFFPKVRNSSMPVAGNLTCTRELLARSLGLADASELIPALVKAREWRKRPACEEEWERGRPARGEGRERGRPARGEGWERGRPARKNGHEQGSPYLAGETPAPQQHHAGGTPALPGGSPTVDTSSAPCMERAVEPCDLSRLPVLRHLADDGGPYITSCVVVVDDPVLGRNLSFHRLMVTGPDTATIRVVKSRGLDQAIEHAGGEIDAAFLIGAPPQTLLAAAMSPADDVDETLISQALADTPMTACKTVNLAVPAETEIVLEGRITRERGDEGPFIDLTETLDIVRQEPVVRFSRMTHRDGAFYHALLPGKGDHRALMGLPREADIFSGVNEVCKCLDVCMSPGGCSWLHAVVRIEKSGPDDPRLAFEAALAAHPSLKRVIVVDADIDAHDPAAVEWALATRFQAHRGLMVHEGRPSSSLDPSADHPPGRKSVGSKLGMDATAHRKGADFARLQYPALDAGRMEALFGGNR